MRWRLVQTLVILSSPTAHSGGMVRVRPAIARQFHQVARVGTTKQLLLQVRATAEDGSSQRIKVLIDTSCQANLIRKGLVAPHLMQDSDQPKTLITADGSIMEGGQKEVELTLAFGRVEEGLLVGEYEASAVFHEAALEVDAILGYPWMAQQHLGIFPHYHALALEGPPWCT